MVHTAASATQAAAPKTALCAAIVAAPKIFAVSKLKEQDALP